MLKCLKKINIKIVVVIALLTVVGIAFIVGGIDPVVLNMVMGAAVLVTVLFVIKIILSFIHLPFGYLINPEKYLVVKKSEINVNPTDKSK